MVIWAGKGFIVAILVFGCSLIVELATEQLTGNNEFYQQSSWAFPIALMMSGGLTAIAAILLVPSGESKLHTLFFIPMIWWAAILPIIGLGIFIWSALNSPNEPAPLLDVAK